MSESEGCSSIVDDVEDDEGILLAPPHPDTPRMLKDRINTRGLHDVEIL